MNKKLTYFVSDVHLGLQVADPAAREARFVEFLRSLPEDTESLYLLGDIWDFWYEYRDVVPKGYVRVFGAIADLIDQKLTQHSKITIIQNFLVVYDGVLEIYIIC